MKGIFRAIIFVILLISVVTFGRDIYGQIKKFEEIRAVEIEAKRLEEQNEALKKTLEEGKLSFNLEKQARDNLNYSRKGDTLYVVDLHSSLIEEQDEKKENWQKWLDLVMN